MLTPRQLVRRVLGLFRPRRLDRDLEDELGVLAAFAAMALCLGAAGIFGLMSFATAERIREIGVRMAPGARPRPIR